MRRTAPPRSVGRAAQDGVRKRASGRVAKAGTIVSICTLAVLAGGCRYLSRLPWPSSLPALESSSSYEGEYLVRPGDDLDQVAAWHGTSANALARANGISARRPLQPGVRLRVPIDGLAHYTVQPGDTLSRLGLWYGIDFETIARTNDVRDPRRLEIGRVLRIPATAERRDAPPPSRRSARVAAVRAPTLPQVSAAPAARTRTPVSPDIATAAASQEEVESEDATTRAKHEPAAADPVAARRRAEADDTLDRARTAFDEADFEKTLALTGRARALPNDDPSDDDNRRRLASAELLRGMAQVALGEEEQALASFEAALEFDPLLELDDAEVSPKIVSVFREAQARRPSSRTVEDLTGR